MKPAQQRLSARQTAVLVAVCLGLYVTLLDVNILVVARPTIQEALQLTLPQLQWMSNAYSITVAALILPAGKLIDLFGRRRLFLLGAAAFLLGSLVSGVSGLGAAGVDHAFRILMSGRLLQGLGAAMLLPAGLAVLSDAFTHEKRARAFGVYGAVTGLGAASAPLLGGVLVQYLEWYWVFLVNVPLALAAVVFAAAAIEQDAILHRGREPLDWRGGATSAMALLLFMGALIEANHAKASWLVLGAMMGGSLVFAFLFFFCERTARNPILELRFLSVPNLMGPMGVAFLVNAGGFASFFILTLYLQNTLRMQPLQIGLLMIPFNVALLLAALLGGRWMPKLGARRLIAFAMALLAGGLLLVLHPLGIAASPLSFIPGFLLMGAGIGLANPPVSATATGAVPRENTGTASGMLVFSRQLGNALGIALLSLVLTVAYQADLTRLAADPNTQAPADVSRLLAEASAAGPVDGPRIASQGGAQLAAAVQQSFVFAVGATVVVAALLALLGLLAGRLVTAGAGRLPSAPASRARSP